MSTMLEQLARVLRGEDPGPPLLNVGDPAPNALATTGAGDPPDTPDTSPAARRVDARDRPGANVDTPRGPDHPALAPDPAPVPAPDRFPVHLLDPLPVIPATSTVLLAETRTIGTGVEYVGLDPSRANGLRVAYLVAQVTSATGTAYIHAGRAALTSQRYPLAAGAGLALDGLGGLWLSSPDSAAVSLLVVGVGPGPR